LFFMQVVYQSKLYAVQKGLQRSVDIMSTDTYRYLYLYLILGCNFLT
jgi:hypothetical protein